MELLVAGLLIVLAVGLMGASQGLRAAGMIRSSQKKERVRLQTRRHLLHGTQLLNRSKPKAAALEADKALAMDPRDAASHVLKALALERQGHMAAALRSLNTALKPPMAKTLGPSEKAQALVKRAEIAVNGGFSRVKRRLDLALGDLHASLAINPENVKAHCLMGRCYEQKGLRAEAVQAYQAALRVDPSSQEADEGLSHLS